MGYFFDRFVYHIFNPNFLGMPLWSFISNIAAFIFVQSVIYIAFIKGVGIFMLFIIELLVLLLYYLYIKILYRTAKDFKRITGHWTWKTLEGYYRDR